MIDDLSCLQAANGVTKKPKNLIVDIDAEDAENELAAVEYVEDMYNYYKLTEVCKNYISCFHFLF